MSVETSPPVAVIDQLTRPVGWSPQAASKPAAERSGIDTSHVPGVPPK